MSAHVLSLGLIMSIVFSACSNPRKSQNFLFILVDDLGWTDLGFTGSTFYETPFLDTFREDCMYFPNAYSAGSVCSPTRAAIMTGKHPATLQITDWIPGANPKGKKWKTPSIKQALPLEEVTIAEVLKAQGYQTFFAGKWHLGDEGFFPEDQGFTINKGGHHRGSPPGGYYVPYENPKLTDGPEGEYLTDRLTNEAIHFLKNKKEHPFFLMLSYYTVHTPIEANTTYIASFEKKRAQLNLDTIPTQREGTGITTLLQQDAAYASMLYALDQNVKRLITFLKKEGLYESTTIIFTSDNGGLSTLERRRNRPGPTSVLPLRGGKGWLFEGGIRVPLLIKPAYFQEKNSSSEALIVSQDFYPTILALADIPIPAEQEVEGLDIRLIWEKGNSLDRDQLIWYYPHYHGSAWTPGAAIRQGKWKLVEFYETSNSVLFNLEEDLGEQHDLSIQYPEKVKELSAALESWKANF